MFSWLYKRREKKIAALAVKAVSHDPDVRKKALKRLGRIRDPRAVAPIIKALFHPISYWPHDGGQPSITHCGEREALKQLGVLAFEDLVQALEDPSFQDNNYWWGFSASEIIIILGDMGDCRVLAPLLSLLSDEKRLNRALMYFAHPSPLRATVKALDKIEPNWYILEAAQMAIPSIAKLLYGEEGKYDVMTAAYTLTRIGGSKSAEALREATETLNELVRNKETPNWKKYDAKDSLKEIGIGVEKGQRENSLEGKTER